jgi:hypothetical protein
MAWRSFAWAGSSGFQNFDSSWCFFSANCGSSISPKFLIYGVHAVCFCPVVTLLNLLRFSHFYNYPQLAGQIIMHYLYMINGSHFVARRRAKKKASKSMFIMVVM